MIIGFLGKGGSGKSTLSSAFTEFLLTDQNNTVLAVDADHNMDLLFRLGATELPTYLGDAMSDLMEHCKLSSENSYRDIFSDSNEDPVFSLSPKDMFTNKYAHPVKERLLGMAGGPHTDDVLYDRACSHVLSTPLKVYFPYLTLKENEYVVVDEKAGADGVGTGIASGFDHAFVVLEPTLYGIKAGHQIADLLEWFGTPYDFVVNKVFDEEDFTFAAEKLRKAPIGAVKNTKQFARGETMLDEPTQTLFELMRQRAGAAPPNRKERSIAKIKRNETQQGVTS
jgi:CO dehydrogenase maturation factor